MNMNKVQKNIVDKELTQLTNKELKYVQKPLGKALYKGRPKKKEDEKAHWSDRIKCDVCAKEFTRSARNAHNLTKEHLIYSKMNKKLKKLLIDD